MTTTPPEMGMLIYKAIYQTADITDPFKEIKQQCTAHLMARYDEFKKQIVTSEDPLYTALKFSCLGNAIDFGANPDFDITKDSKTMKLAEKFDGKWEEGYYAEKDKGWPVFYGDDGTERYL